VIIHIYFIAAPFPPDQLPEQLPAPFEESSILGPSIGEVEVGQPTDTCKNVEEETKRRKQKLIDSLGYSSEKEEKLLPTGPLGRLGDSLLLEYTAITIPWTSARQWQQRSPPELSVRH